MVIAQTQNRQRWLNRLTEIGRYASFGGGRQPREPFSAALDILLVDADEMDLALARQALAFSGLHHRVDVAHDGQQAA